MVPPRQTSIAVIVEQDERFVELRLNGDRDLRNALVEDNRRLADFIAKRYAGRGVPEADLRQVAYIGLINAVDRFDPEVGVRFATFAGRTIEGEVKRYFRDKTWMVRVPRGAQELSLAVRNSIEALSAELGRAPRPAEVADALGVSEDAVIEALDASASRSVDSLDRPVGQEGFSVGDGIGGVDAGFDAFEGELTIRQLLPIRSEREREIVELRLYEGLTQSEIADRIGISQMHVSRLLRRSFEVLREAMQH